MIYKRHYLQFNDLVFYEYDMIDEGEYSLSFKHSTTEYGFAHGAYMNLKGGSFVKSGTVALTLVLNMKKLPCDKRPYYRRFALSQLSKPGKLWAVQDNTIVWAHAVLSGYNEVQRTRRDTITIDLDFIFPEGVWHKADKQRTFIVPFDICDFMDCYDFKDDNPCEDGCCDCVTVKDASPCCECGCDEVAPEHALCYFDDYQGLYACYNRYRLIYDCVAADKFFSQGAYGRHHLGAKLTGDCGMITAKYYSGTDVDTTDISLRIHAEMKDPYIEINGNGNIIKGEYSGYLYIHSDGSLYSGECDNCDPLSVDKWVIPKNMDYGWTIHPGYNRINIQTNTCCGNPVAYIDVGELTY